MHGVMHRGRARLVEACGATWHVGQPRGLADPTMVGGAFLLLESRPTCHSGCLVLRGCLPC
jgi:hypothetical protein